MPSYDAHPAGENGQPFSPTPEQTATGIPVTSLMKWIPTAPVISLSRTSLAERPIEKPTHPGGDSTVDAMGRWNPPQALQSRATHFPIGVQSMMADALRDVEESVTKANGLAACRLGTLRRSV